MFEITFKIEQPSAEVAIVKLDNGEVWKRNGYCNRCGMCCDNIKGDLAKENSNDCKHQKHENLNDEKVSVCKIYWTRPYQCAVYPFDPYDELYEKCSYSWERVK